MTAPSLWAVGSALALVLGLVAFAAWVVRRITTGAQGRVRPGGIEVVSRVALAPRQGVAVISVDGRRALITYGEGGVRHLMDLDSQTAVSDGSVEPEHSGQGSIELPFATALRRARSAGTRALTMFAVLFVMCSVPGLAGAQTAPTGGPEVAREASTDNAAARDAVAALVQSAPRVSLAVGGEGEDGLQLSGPVATVLFMGFMTVIPTLLLLTTGFARILIVLHLLKQALGTQTAPPAHLLTAMALLLTGFVMAPTFDAVHQTAIAPWVAGDIDEMQMLEAGSIPVRQFMLSSVREQDLATFVAMRQGPAPATIEEVPFVVVTSAFVTSELTKAFQMGFALFLPFVVIDVVVASVLMSMGMFMLPPVMVSLPFKLLLFVLVDGWSLVMGSIVQSF